MSVNPFGPLLPISSSLGVVAFIILPSAVIWYNYTGLRQPLLGKGTRIDPDFHENGNKYS